MAKINVGINIFLSKFNAEIRIQLPEWLDFKDAAHWEFTLTEVLNWNHKHHFCSSSSYVHTSLQDERSQIIKIFTEVFGGVEVYRDMVSSAWAQMFENPGWVLVNSEITWLQVTNCGLVLVNWGLMSTTTTMQYCCIIFFLNFAVWFLKRTNSSSKGLLNVIY